MNNYQTQQVFNDINSIIGFTMSVILMGFMVGMVRPMGKFFEPPLRPEKHLPKPIVKEVTVPGGVYWKCISCGKELPPGTEVFKAGKEVYCSIPCIRLPEHHSSESMTKSSRARQIAIDIITALSQRYTTPEPNLIFKPLEVEAKFEEPSTILVNDTFEEIVNTARAPKWDKFLRTVVAHEFKHYLQYRELGIPLSEIPEKEYGKYEQEAEMFGLEWGKVSSFEEMGKMIAIANGAGALYLGGMPMEEAIRVATEEVEVVFRKF